MRRRKFMVGLGSLAAGASAVMGTGAFDFWTGRRDADITVVSDADGILQLTPERSQYAEYVNNQLSIQLNGNMNSTNAQGVNKNAQIVINDIFSVQNRGDERVVVTVDDGGNSDVSWDDTTGGDDADGSADFESGVGIDPGVRRYVGAFIDTRGFNAGDTILSDTDKLVISAEDLGSSST